MHDTDGQCKAGDPRFFTVSALSAGFSRRSGPFPCVTRQSRQRTADIPFRLRKNTSGDGLAPHNVLFIMARICRAIVDLSSFSVNNMLAATANGSVH
jgi:hypothetical protein